MDSKALVRGVRAGAGGANADAREPRSEILISEEVAAALRDLRPLDADLERVVYAMRGATECVVLGATDAELEELLDAVAAEANHGTNRRRQRRLDAALDAFVGAGGG